MSVKEGWTSRIGLPSLRRAIHGRYVVLFGDTLPNNVYLEDES